MADLYTIHWLEHLGVEYAVISDHDFHDLGEAALAGHPVVISAGHHEYWTERMLDALDGYLRGGGRFMYLGGNGLYWVTSIDSRRPHLMEVRRFGGHSTSKAEPGERQHSTTLETGGTWRVRGRPPQQLVGVGFGGVGFTRAAGYRRLPGSFDPRAAFIFEGVGADDPSRRFRAELGRGGRIRDRPFRARARVASARATPGFVVRPWPQLLPCGRRGYRTRPRRYAGPRGHGLFRNAQRRRRLQYRFDHLDRITLPPEL